MRFYNKRTRKRRISTLVVIMTMLLCFLNPEFLALNSKTKRMEDKLFENKTGLKNSKISGKIYINNWSSAVEAGICTGSGNFLDPYVIKDLVIDGGGTGTGIFIEDSKNYYFRIENCTIFNCETGIRFNFVNNGTLYRNNCSFNTYGIVDGTLGGESSNNTILENIVNNNNDSGVYFLGIINNSKIIGNTINNNDYGINLGPTGYFNNSIISNNTVNENYIGIFQCSVFNSIISNNILYNNDQIAISLFLVRANIFTSNLMKGSGLSLWLSDLDDISLYNIDSSNLVNNKHIYYYMNKTNLREEEFFDAGQIFLINCIDSTIANVDVSYSSQGISLYHSNNITVMNINSSNNIDGILLYNTNNSYIIGNTLIKNGEGIAIDGWSNNNTISGNNIKSNGYGIYLHFYCDHNTISDNFIDENHWGILISGSSNNILNGNIIKSNIDNGVRLVGGGPFPCDNNSFFLNFFRENGKHVQIFGNGTNSWNNTEIGNYWDNYTGLDANGDGIGDTPYNISSSPLIQDFLPIVDNEIPEITIFSPSNNSIFGSTAPSFEIEVNESHLDLLWYTLDGGLYNYTFTKNGTIDQPAWDELSDAQVRLRFYAIDKVGNIAFAEIILTKSSSNPAFPTIIIFAMVISTIGIISIGVLLITRKKNRLKP